MSPKASSNLTVTAQPARAAVSLHQQQQQRLQLLHKQKEEQQLQQLKLQQQLQKQQSQNMASTSSSSPQTSQETPQPSTASAVEQKIIVTGQNQPQMINPPRPGGGATIITPISQPQPQPQPQVQPQPQPQSSVQGGAVIIQNLNPARTEQQALRPGGIINMLPQQPVNVTPEMMAKAKPGAEVRGQTPQPAQSPQQVSLL